MSNNLPPTEAEDGSDPEIDALWTHEASDRLGRTGAVSFRLNI